jgi:hypothetical protein
VAVPYRTLRLHAPGNRMTGEDIEAFQQALNGHLATYAGLHEGSDQLITDGSYGPATRSAFRWVGWYVTGFPTATIHRGAGVEAQQLIRDPSGLTDRHRRRAEQRRRDLASESDGPAAPGYPLGLRGVVIGRPGEGTHSWERAPNNWQSDNAIDIGVPKGTGVYAVVAGRIDPRFGPLNSPDPRFQGIRLYVNGTGNSWYYAHLDSTVAGIKPGVSVKRGQLLGRSGVANGSPHLHLGCEHGDPRSVL